MLNESAVNPYGFKHGHINNVQALRAVAAVLVVGAHLGGATGFVSKLTQPAEFWVNFEDVGRSGVDLFFVISGFIMVVTTVNMSHGTTGARNFIWRRAGRVYPPYLVITAGIFAVYKVRPDLVNSSQQAPPDILASFLLLPQVGAPLLLVGWTLVYEMYFYLVFTLALVTPRRVSPYVFAVWGLLTVLAAALPGGNPYVDLVASPLNFEFLLGVLVGHFVIMRRLRIPGTVAVVAFISSLAIFGALLSGRDPSMGSTWVRVLTTGLAFAGLLYGLVGCEKQERVQLPRFLTSLGDSSYSLYLTHVLTLKVLSVLLVAAGVTGGLSQVLIAPAALGAAVIAGVIFYRLLEVPLLR